MSDPSVVESLPHDIVIDRIVQACKDNNYGELIKLDYTIPLTVTTLKKARDLDYETLEVLDLFVLCVVQEPNTEFIVNLVSNISEVCEYIYENNETLFGTVVEKFSVFSSDHICRLVDVLIHRFRTYSNSSNIFVVAMYRYVLTMETVSMYVEKKTYDTDRMGPLACFCLFLDREDLLNYMLVRFQNEDGDFYDICLFYSIYHGKKISPKYFDAIMSFVKPGWTIPSVVLLCVEKGYVDLFIKCINYGAVSDSKSYEVIGSCLWNEQKEMLEISMNYFDFDEDELYRILSRIGEKDIPNGIAPDFLLFAIKLLQQSGLTICKNSSWIVFTRRLIARDYVREYKYVAQYLNFTVPELYKSYEWYQCGMVYYKNKRIVEALRCFISFGLELSYDDYAIPRFLLRARHDGRKILSELNFSLDELSHFFKI